jgi:hypothetical protein
LRRSHLSNPGVSCVLAELGFDVLEKAPTKRGDGVVRRDEAEGYRVISRPFELAAGKHASRVTINQKALQRRRMVRGQASTAITFAHGSEIKPVDHLDNKPGQVPLGKPLVDRWR